MSIKKVGDQKPPIILPGANIHLFHDPNGFLAH